MGLDLQVWIVLAQAGFRCHHEAGKRAFRQLSEDTTLQTGRGFWRPEQHLLLVLLTLPPLLSGLGQSARGAGTSCPAAFSKPGAS
jgi:hypothetical protein